MPQHHRISILTLVSVLGALAVSASHAAENRVVVSGDGPDVVLIPGLASDGAALRPLAEHLAACRRIHTFTLAGFAGQPPLTVRDGESRMELWEAQIADYLRTLPTPRAVLIGHSLGGVLAMKLAIDHPERIERLVILDSLPFFAAALMPGATSESVKPRAAAMRDVIRAQSADAFRAAQNQALRTMTMKPDAVPMLVDWSIRSDRATLAEAYYELLVLDLRDALSRIRVPALVLIPTNDDQPVGPETVRTMYAEQYGKLQQATLVTIANSRHFLTLDQPRATESAVDEFLAACNR